MAVFGQMEPVTSRGGPPAGPITGRYDADRLMASYRAARAQEALFDLRHGPGGGYDECVDRDGNVRPAWAELTAHHPTIASQKLAELFAADPQFESKMFALSHIWRSHRFGGLPG